MRGFHFFLFLFFNAISVFGYGQTSVTLHIKNNRSEPLSFATVTVTAVKDSSIKFEKLTDSTGAVSFYLNAGMNYQVVVSSVNYLTVEKHIKVTEKPAVFNWQLEQNSKTLSTVVITSSKPLMKQDDDKTIVDPENLAASSTNAYEIIEKTPGLYVDQDGNIYLNSTTPAIVYINGREQKMSAADIATMLKSLPPNSIASIEILHTPSAKYDASGSGGIVNVILKKGVRIGLTGSVNVGMNQGKYGNQFAGINLNNNNGRTTVYLNFQFQNRKGFEQVKTDRLFTTDSVLSQDAYTIYPANSFYLGYGLNYELNKNWNISYDGRFNYSRSQNNTDNHSVIRSVMTDAVSADNRAEVSNRGRNNNLSQGASVKYKIDSLGSEWSSDLSFTYAPNHTDQDFLNNYFIPLKPQSHFTGEIENKLQFFSAQTNLQKKYPKKITMETGLKTTSVSFNNKTVYNLTSSYRYNEHIHAAYLQGSKNISGVIFKLGARLENTNMHGEQLKPKDTSFNVNRTDLFPYIYISRDLMKIATYQLRAYLIYRRTISRPAYEYLNPYPRVVDQYLYESGNPSLRPQFTQNYEANVSFEERPIFAFGVNDTKDIFTQVVYRTDSSDKRFIARTYDNLGKNKEIYFRALGALPPGKRYFFVAGMQYNHNYYQGLYENKPLSFKKGSWSVFTYHTFKITPLTQLSLNGFARFKGQLQFYELSSFGAFNMNLTQQFLKRKLVVTISGSDLFYTNRNDFTISQGSVDASGFRRSDTRRFGLNVRYNFGFRKKEENNLFNVESPEKAN
jgi:iron complex outermembrane recepter protein